VRLTRDGSRYNIERLIECTFVPLVRQPRAPQAHMAVRAAEGEARG